jgi:hypothetical protein
MRRSLSPSSSGVAPGAENARSARSGTKPAGKLPTRSAISAIEGLTDDERDDLLETRMAAVWDKLKPWVRYQEYVTVVIDTDAGTARVVEQH